MNNSIDQQFVEFVVKSLVSKPDAVKVERRIDEKGVLLELTVDPEDLGRVIGKHGVTAQSLRTLLRALGTKNDARYNLKIIDNGDGGHMRRDLPRTEAMPTEMGHDESIVPSATDDDHYDGRANDEAPMPSQGDHETPENDRFERTRKELEELDDLDV